MKKAKWYTKWYTWLAGIASAILGLFLISNYSKRSKRENVDLPNADTVQKSSSKAADAVTQAKEGPTKVEPTDIDKKSIADLRKEYDEL